MKYAWIDGQRDSYPLQAMCEMLNVSTSGYAEWMKCGGLKALAERMSNCWR